MQALKLDGYHFMYQGDSSAPGWLVYNFRCTTVAVMDGVDSGDTMRRGRDPETGQNALVEDMTYDEWAKWKMAKGAFYGLSLQPKPITMESINTMKAFQSVTLGASAQIRLKNMHKQLLLEVRKQPLGTEVARCFGLDMIPLTGYIVGKEKSHTVQIPDMQENHIAIHTHPSNSTFSEGDLNGLVKRDNMKMLTAVGHDGHIYAIEKTGKYNKREFMKKVIIVSNETKKLEIVIYHWKKN